MTERISLKIAVYLFNIGFTCKYFDYGILAEGINKSWFPKAFSLGKGTSVNCY